MNAGGNGSMDLLEMLKNLLNTRGLDIPACKCSYDTLTEEICVVNGQDDDGQGEGLTQKAWVTGRAWDNHHSALSEMTLEYCWDEVRRATCSFSGDLMIGGGRFSTVYSGRLEEGVDVAAKVLEGPFSEADIARSFAEEVCLLSRCRHPNVVMLLGFSVDAANERKALVYELLPGGSAYCRLHESQEPYTWQERLQTSIEVSRGLAHLHKYRPEVFHRDIKTAIILFSAQGVAKIADFGLACTSRCRSERWSAVAVANGTPGYAAPEYAETNIATEASEVYSAGMVLLEMLTGQLPAKPAVDGRDEWTFLLETVRPEIDNARERVLNMLDPSADWPLPKAAGIASFALNCIHCDANRRPCFLEMVVVLQNLAASVPKPTVAKKEPKGEVVKEKKSKKSKDKRKRSKSKEAAEVHVATTEGAAGALEGTEAASPSPSKSLPLLLTMPAAATPMTPAKRTAPAAVSTPVLVQSLPAIASESMPAPLASSAPPGSDPASGALAAASPASALIASEGSPSAAAAGAEPEAAIAPGPAVSAEAVDESLVAGSGADTSVGVETHQAHGFAGTDNPRGWKWLRSALGRAPPASDEGQQWQQPSGMEASSPSAAAAGQCCQSSPRSRSRWPLDEGEQEGYEDYDSGGDYSKQRGGRLLAVGLQGLQNVRRNVTTVLATAAQAASPEPNNSFNGSGVEASPEADVRGWLRLQPIRGLIATATGSREHKETGDVAEEAAAAAPQGLAEAAQPTMEAETTSYELRRAFLAAAVAEEEEEEAPAPSAAAAADTEGGCEEKVAQRDKEGGEEFLVPNMAAMGRLFHISELDLDD